MKHHISHAVICTTLLCLGLTAGTVVQAATKVSSGGGREAFFRCKDAQGQVHFSDSMPPECMNLDTEVLSERGNVMRVIPGAAALAEKAARKNADEAEAKAKADAAMRDRMLVEAYLSVKEIEALRNQRLELLDAQMRVDEQNMSAFKDRENRLLRQIERYKPYSDKPNASPIPDHFAEDMVNLIKSRDTTQERMSNRLAERRDVEAKFASDIQRFKELKGDK
jgi:hypothetical protein